MMCHLSMYFPSLPKFCYCICLFEDGILLLEVNRLLRAGGYFAWAAQPVYKHEEAQQEAWKGIFYLLFLFCTFCFVRVITYNSCMSLVALL
jgi:hypothetical protein